MSYLIPVQDLMVKYGPRTDYLIDKSAAREILEDLELAHPVAIQTKLVASYYGRYAGLLNRPHGSRRSAFARRCHVIILCSDMDATQACRTLAHELRHAHQCEAWHGGDHTRMFHAYNRELKALRASTRSSSQAVYARYRQQSYEADAIAYEEHGEILNLCRDLGTV